MNRSIQLKIEAIKKKLNCSQSNCGEHFAFEITAEKLAIAKQNSRFRYQGKCARCGTVLKLSASGMAALAGIAGTGRSARRAAGADRGDPFVPRACRGAVLHAADAGLDLSVALSPPADLRPDSRSGEDIPAPKRAQNIPVDHRHRGVQVHEGS